MVFNKIENIVKMEKRLLAGECDKDTLLAAKKMGFTDKMIAKNVGITVSAVKTMRTMWNIKPGFSMVDTCAAEFAAQTPYYYSDYGVENEVDPATDKKKVLVLGSGPIRIGQGIEFDYCSVHNIWALEKLGYETVIINNNPETVSTDFDVADKLYFEPLTPEYVANIVELEKPDGAVVQFGGQTAIKLTKALHDLGVHIFGRTRTMLTPRRTASVLTPSSKVAISRGQRGRPSSPKKRLSLPPTRWATRCWCARVMFSAVGHANRRVR